MTPKLFTWIRSELKKNSAITGKYWIEESHYEKLKKDGSKEEYFHLLFLPHTYGINDFCCFALEYNDDPTIGFPRFAIGVRKEYPCKQNPKMVYHVESTFGSKGIDWFLGGKNISEKQMNLLHWARWGFFGDINQYDVSSTSPTATDLPSLIKDNSLFTTKNDFRMFLEDWLLKYK